MEKKTVDEQGLSDFETNFSDWYNEVVYKADLADLAPVRGCMVIKPYGFALWENIRRIMDEKFEANGIQNAQFPLLIPYSFFQKEADHIEGFSPELALVTHAGGKELEEPLVVRPTSETIIYAMFARWITSWRDLPIKINQWANVVRWEMRTRPFLRTTEFWWQEGHTAHATSEEALVQAKTMLLEYVNLAENYLAIPVVAGEKSPSERFAGANYTFTIEGLMPDGKALQMGTSHGLAQHFSNAFGMQFQNKDGALSYPFCTSWGITTRLIGALIMTHGDQKGIILPPRIAPYQVVIIPIYSKKIAPDLLRAACNALSQVLKKANIRVTIDFDEHTSAGTKFYTWELKGVPLRLELGARDIEANSCVLVDRITGVKDIVGQDEIIASIEHKLLHIQDTLFTRARERRARQWFVSSSLSEFGAQIDEQPGFYQTGWCGSAECEKMLKPYKASIRCLLPEKQLLNCCVCTKQSIQDILVAKSY